MSRKPPEATANTPESSPILVVDDNYGKRVAIESILAPLGQTIVLVDSGEAALREVMRRSFAVILMDVHMPIMDGYETARLIRMRSESEHTPIIFVTAHEKEEAEIPTAYASGAVDFIFSPIVPEILRAKAAIFVDLFRKSCAVSQAVTDITRLSDQFRDSELRTRAVLDNVADAIVTLDDDGVIESFNRAASVLFGYHEREAIGQPLALMVPSKHSADFSGQTTEGRLPLDQRLVNKGSTEGIGLRKDGSTFPMEVELSDVELGKRKILIGCLRDISDRQTYTDALRYQALHDDLTHLPNRVLFSDRVIHAIQAAMRGDHLLAVLVMDLDEFKEVNDTLGHQHGDVLLKLVADRLVACLRDGDTVARLGGDEFGILPFGETDLAGAAAVAWKIQRALEPSFLVEGNVIDVRGSIGISLFPNNGTNIDDLLRRADLAMYDAKRSGSGFALFAVEQEEAPARRLALLGDLRHCIERDELMLHYQPKVDLAHRQTIGLEALIRWNHPSGRLVMPGEFMDEVERNELLIPITEWVIGEALRDLEIWREAGHDLTMAVNIGARCLAPGTGIFEMIDELTSYLGIPREKLILELTESAFVDTDLPGLVSRLREMDQRLSIDDFGTGYSSLAYLQRLPVCEIKADRSFVSTLASIGDDAIIVRSIIDLAHNLGLNVVAEGVEDQTTMDLLIGYGCDAAQGYFFSRPMPSVDLLQWLEDSPFGLPRRSSNDSELNGCSSAGSGIPVTTTLSSRAR